MTKLPTESELLKKYDVPTPRYTSYPAMPYWETEKFTREKWIDSVKKTFDETNESKGISLYIHLPFCESLCTYCACNTRITKNHQYELQYIRSLLGEWEQYKKLFGKRPLIRELHLGGGTPTFFSPENLKLLITSLLEDCRIHATPEFSFEGHPNNTTQEHLQTFFNLGFRRVSFGVQDLNEKVQRTINRIQPFANLKKVNDLSRAIGYQSVSFDLIYGLPFQTPSTIIDTFEKVLTLRPDRVSFYSYAHVPWLKPGQRGYEDADLPSDVMKRLLYETGRSMLKTESYEDIGMDHFALPHDSLLLAHKQEKLRRNFMGYTTTETDLLIGLGSSAISDAKYAYAQNAKKVEDYASAISHNGLAIAKGHIQTDQDLLVKKCILQVACQGSITLKSLVELNERSIIASLHSFCHDGILARTQEGFQVTPIGRAFIRNICGAFDLRYQATSSIFPDKQLFSKAI